MVVVILVVDAVMMLVEMLGVVVSLDVVVMFYDLSAVVHAMVVMVMVVCPTVLRVVCISVLQRHVYLSALLQRSFVYEMTVGALVVAVVEVADEFQQIATFEPVFPLRHYHQTLLTVDVDALHISLDVNLQVTDYYTVSQKTGPFFI